MIFLDLQLCKMKAKVKALIAGGSNNGISSILSAASYF